MQKVHGNLLIISHVLLLKYGDLNYIQGAFGRHVDAFACRFDKVYLLTCVDKATEPLNEYHIQAENVEIISIPNIWHSKRILRYLFRLRGMIYASLKLPSIIARCSVIHTRLPSPIGITGTLISRIMHKPTLVYIAGDREELLLLKGSFMRPIAWIIQRISRLLVNGCVCFTTGPTLARKFGGPSELVIPVVSAAMTSEQIVEARDALERAQRTVRELLFIGAIGEAKGVDILLQAIQNLRDQGKELHLRLIGKTHDNGVWLRRHVSSLALDDIVTHSNHMSWNMVIHEYEKSDLFVLPSLGEGVPHVIIEAMSRGVPVVASSVGGIPWIIQHGENGLLVSPGSSTELSQALIHLIEDVELRKKLVLGGLKLAEKSTMDSVINAMVEKVCQVNGILFDSVAGK